MAWLSRSVLSILLSLCLAAASSANTAATANTDVAAPPQSITWLINELPPFFITKGEFSNQGICDEVLKSTMAATPDIEHKVEVLPFARIFQRLDDGDKVCFPCMIHRGQATSRATFTVPTTVYPPHVLMVREHTKRRLIHKYGNPVPLADLLADPHYVFIRYVNRLFGPPLQPIIDASPVKHNQVTNSKGDLGTMTLLRMVALQRADYTIDYPSIVHYFNLISDTTLHPLAIAENRAHQVLGTIGCASSAPDNFAQEVVDYLNPILQEKVLSSPAFQENMVRWFKEKEDYMQRYQDKILGFDSAKP